MLVSALQEEMKNGIAALRVEGNSASEGTREERLYAKMKPLREAVDTVLGPLFSAEGDFPVWILDEDGVLEGMTLEAVFGILRMMGYCEKEVR